MSAILKQFTEPIDVIIVGHSYRLRRDDPVDLSRLGEDATFQELQTLYSMLAKRAREVVFMPVGHFDTGLVPHLAILQRKMLREQDLSIYRIPTWVSFSSEFLMFY